MMISDIDVVFVVHTGIFVNHQDWLGQLTRAGAQLDSEVEVCQEVLSWTTMCCDRLRYTSPTTGPKYSVAELPQPLDGG
jgi:hypothetical protein